MVGTGVPNDRPRTSGPGIGTLSHTLTRWHTGLLSEKGSRNGTEVDACHSAFSACSSWAISDVDKIQDATWWIEKPIRFLQSRHFPKPCLPLANGCQRAS